MSWEVVFMQIRKIFRMAILMVTIPFELQLELLPLHMAGNTVL